MASALSATSAARLCAGLTCWGTVAVNGQEEKIAALSGSRIGLKGWTTLLPKARKQKAAFNLRCANPETSTMTSSSSPTPPSTSATPASSLKGGVTVEFQRQKAKELTAYFEERKYEEKVRQGRIFGWTRANEINNGRWTMFGIAVGLLTEYATGVSLVDQIKIIISNLGIADI